jgi:hypothetical protein
VYGNFFQYRIKLFQLQTLGGVLPVFGGNVAGSPGHATVFVLSAFHDYLYAIAFLCHMSFRKRSAKVRENFIPWEALIKNYLAKVY